MLKVKKINTPLGAIYLGAQNERLKFLSFDKHKCTESCDVLDAAHAQLLEYFKGERKTFKLPLDLSGTQFQQLAWKALIEIPYGKTVSYKAQAAMLGDIKKARAIGLANGKNPLPIIVPCHRVVRTDGKLGGYSCGIEKKIFLLELEKKGLG